MKLGRRQLLASAAALALPGAARAEPEADAAAAAAWIAGLAGGSGEEWGAFARAEDEHWKAGEPRRRALRAWSDQELRPLVPAGATLFYPFGGPDVLHALTLFPAARRVVLAGLEPIGALPPPGAAPPGYFARLEASFAELHRLGFFRTADMATDFARDGVLGVLVTSVVRLGGTVERIAVVPASEAAPPTARLDFRLEGEARRLEYVRCDLANGGLRAWPGLATLGPFVALVKAAMYLLPEPRFAVLRQRLLDDATVILQDDTGVPFRAFDERWATRLYGSYEAPRKPFEDRLQPDLRAAYARKGARPLPFGIGYAIEPRRSNLLLAARSA